MSSNYDKLARAIMSNAGNIIDAIDTYITKAEDDLAETLADEGYPDAEDSVEAIGSFEEQLETILSGQTKKLLKILKKLDNKAYDKLKKKIKAMQGADDIAAKVEAAALVMFKEQIPKLANVYIKDLESDLVISTVRNSTTRWMRSWSSKLGNLVRDSTHNQISKLIEDGIKKGYGIDKIAKQIYDGGWRDEFWQARRIATTEVLRAHAVASNEAIMQSPATDRKEWVHTGGGLHPRPNHEAMNGVIVAKDEPFELAGADGGIYYPMYPKDESLPPGESINCHCMVRGIVNDEILGMSLEERQAMQQQIIEEDGL